jgi:acyl-ACP thioesterase
MDRRVVAVTRHVGLADVRPNGRMRLDAIARVVQDVADADATSAPPVGMGMWLLRRMALDIAHTPRFRADLDARTWCSGVGARWAERSTEIAFGEAVCIASTAIWVHVDPDRGVPVPLPPAFDGIWGVGGANERKVSSRLTHGAPPADGARSPWPLRATDLDIVGHVNNSAYWAIVEEELARRGQPVVQRAEIEFRAGLDAGDEVEVVRAERSDGFACWCCVNGDVRASMTVGLA